MSRHPRTRRWRFSLSRRRARGSVRACFELLEDRTLLDAGTGSSAAIELAQPDYTLINPSDPGASPLSTTGPTGTTPTQIRHAYGFDQLSFDGGTVAADGTGTTIAIVDAYDDPNIATDLHQFDLELGIPDPPSFTKVNQTGGSSLPAANSSWSVEISLDVEWAHVIAPGASILLVEATSNSYANLASAAAFAAAQPGVVAVSMSFGGAEFSGEKSYDKDFTTPSGHAGVTFVASSGDNGVPASSPATSPNVLAVGGTTLELNSSGNILSESAWSGSGGGISSYETQPSYQNGVVTQTTTARANPDVAYDANPNTGFPVDDSYANGSSAPWEQVGGTSDAAPQWAGLIALADQGRALAGLGSLDGRSQTLPMLYALPANAFNDITSGASTGSPSYSAGPGYDLATGLGTPQANVIVPDLIGSYTPTSPTPTITWPTPADITYGTALGSSQLDATASYAGSSVSGIFVYTPGTGTVLNAGANQTLSVTFTPSNPSLFTSATATVSINVDQAPLTVTVSAASRLYGQSNPTFGASFQGFVLGQGPSVLGGSLIYGTTATAGSDVSSYTVTASGLTTSNYAITYVSGTLTVDPAPLVVTPSNQSRLYGAANPTLTGTITGLENNDPITATYSTVATVTSDVGTDLILATLNGPANKLADYAIALNTGNLTITPAPLTVTPGNTYRLYGAANPSLTGTITGVVNGDALSSLFTTSATPSSAVGDYPITAVLSGPKLTDYNVTSFSGTLTVTPAPLVVTPGSQTTLYGAPLPTLTGTITGLQNGDPITAAYTTPALPTSDIGLYLISATLNDPANQLGNYSITLNTGVLTINPAPLVVTPASVARLYGAANPTLTGSLSGIQNGDALSASYATTANTGSPVGGYPITAVLSGARLDDYSVTSNIGTLTVNPAPLVITVANTSRTYGTLGPAFNVSYQGFVLGQTAAALGGSLVFDTAAIASSGVGNYSVAAAGLTSDDYAITYAAGTLVVTPAPLTVSPANLARLYGAANPTLTGTITGIENNDAISASYTTTASATSPVGSYSITALLSGANLKDYTVTNNAGTLTVNPAPLVVTPQSLSKLYGAADPTLTGTIIGLENGNPITADYSTSALPTSDVGDFEINATLNDPANLLGNYLVTLNTGNLTIDPAPLVVTPASLVRLYGAANPTLTGTLIGIQNGDSLSASYATLAGPSSPVGPYPITAVLSGAKLGDYSVTSNTGTLAVDPAPLVVTPQSLHRLYGAANPSLTGTFTGLQNGDPITASYTTTALPTSDIGDFDIDATLNDPANLLGNYAVTLNTGILTIDPAPLVVTPEDQARLYGAANPTLTGTITGIQNGDELSASYSTPADAGSPAGSDIITAALSGPRLNDYTLTSNTGTLTVDPAPLLVTVADSTKVYGALDPAFSVGYQGFVLGQSAADLDGGLAFSTTASAGSDIGSYKVSAGGLTSDDYAISYADGTLDVTPAPLTVTPDELSRLYGAANPTLTGTITGIQNGDALSATYSTTASTDSPVGPYTITAGLSGSTLNDYTITANTGTLTINPAPLAVNVVDSSRVYGASNPTFGVTYQGFVLGQTAADLGGSLALSTTASAASSVGSYAVSASGLTSSNYAIAYASGTLAVTPAPLTVTPDDAARIYGAANPTLTGSITGLQNGDPITATYTTSAVATSDVGDVAINAVLNDPANELGNYTVTLDTGTLTINPAPLTVTPEDQSRLYGAPNPTLSGTIAGVLNGDAVSAAYTTTANAGSPAGPYTITAVLSGAKLSDYSVTSNAGTLTVDPAPLVVGVANSSKVYGALDPAFGVTYQGFVLGQTADVLGGSLAFTTTAGSGSGVGSYAVSAGGLTSSNYTITYASGSLEVTPALLTVTPDDLSRLYGAANPTLTGTLSGIQNGDALGASYTTAADPTSAVGAYDITAVLSGANLDDYNVVSNTGTLTVDPAPLIVNVADTSRVYGAANPTLTGTITGLENNDPITASYTTSAVATSDVGTYAITFTLNDPAHALSNYAVTGNHGTLTITPAPLSITPEDIAKTYGDTAVLTGEITGEQNGDRVVASYASGGAAAGADVGSDPITVAGVSGPRLADYDLIENSAVLTVSPAPLTVTAGSATRVAGAANPSFTAQYAGFVLGQGPGVLGGGLSLSTSAAASSPAGQYPITAGGLQSTDYAITYSSGILTVTPAPVTVLTAQWQTERLSRRKTVKVLMVDYSGALEPASAENPANYQLDAAGKVKKLGARDVKAVRIAAAVYNPALHTVALTPAGKLPSGPLQLTIIAAGILDSQGQPLAGNQNGPGGGNYVASVGG